MCKAFKIFFLCCALLVAFFPFKASASMQSMSVLPMIQNGVNPDDKVGVQATYMRSVSDRVMSGTRSVNSNYKKQITSTDNLSGFARLSKNSLLLISAEYSTMEHRHEHAQGNGPVEVTNHKTSALGDTDVSLALYKDLNENNDSTVGGTMIQHQHMLGIAPKVRIPTGRNGGTMAMYDKGIDFGASAFYMKTNHRVYQYYELSGLINRSNSVRSKTGNVFKLDAFVGYNPICNKTTMLTLRWDSSFIEEKNGFTAINGYTQTYTGRKVVLMGPTIMLNYKKHMIMAGYQRPVHENYSFPGFSMGQNFMLMLSTKI